MPRSSANANVCTDLDSECFETQRAVQSLLPVNINLWGTLQAYYVKGFDIARCARLLRCAESSVKARLCRADVVLDLWFKMQDEVKKNSSSIKTP